MRIAQVAPLQESVPPATYGGTERVVSYLTEALVNMGHDVTLFASGDSVTSAKLIACCERALRLDLRYRDSLAWHLIEVETLARHASTFDVIHYHVDYLHFPLSSRSSTPHLTTLHGRLDIPELSFIHQAFPGMPLISISDAQRAPLPHLNWRATIHHGLPDDWGFPEEAPQHLTFLGRISPEKRVDRAIEIAIRSNQPLVIAAKVDSVDREYFDRDIAHLLTHPLVKYVGEVDDHGKRTLLARSTALLFPIDWPEPFGLVMIEALACGVPVIAFRSGSVPEIIEPGVTGYIVDNTNAAVEAVHFISRIDRRRCRLEFEKRFRASQMAERYVVEYQRLIDSSDFTPDLRLSVA